MPAYTDATRVRALCKRLPAFSTTSTVTAEEVEALIDDHEAEVNVALSHHGYAVPVSSPAELKTWLGKIITEGVAAAVLKALYQDPAGPNSESAWSVWEKRYQDALKMIRSDDMVPAATDESGGRGVTSWATDYAGEDSPLVAEAAPAFSAESMVW